MKAYHENIPKKHENNSPFLIFVSYCRFDIFCLYSILLILSIDLDNSNFVPETNKRFYEAFLEACLDIKKSKQTIEKLIGPTLIISS